jgi:hypothetical protein
MLKLSRQTNNGEKGILAPLIVDLTSLRLFTWEPLMADGSGPAGLRSFTVQIHAFIRLIVVGLLRGPERTDLNVQN